MSKKPASATDDSDGDMEDWKRRKLKAQAIKTEKDAQVVDLRIKSMSEAMVERAKIDAEWSDFAERLRINLEKIAGRDNELRLALAEAVESAVIYAKDERDKRDKAQIAQTKNERDRKRTQRAKKKK